MQSIVTTNVTPVNNPKVTFDQFVSLLDYINPV